MAKARIIARNLVANWVGHGANLVVMFFLSPFILHTLGITQFGIWQILMVLTGYMGILDLGVRASTGRHIVLYLGVG
jgi:O-antigen/teichoic acid export membrane protein